jgi:hypothetical protein
MVKFRLYYDKDKETEWLNQMSDEGYAMKAFFAGFYKFESCEKGEWRYQIDIGQGFGRVNSSYREFMNEMGVEIVQCWGPWVTLRKKAADGEFELYTDVDSQIGQYKKIALMFKIVMIVELIGFFYELYLGLKYPAGLAFAMIIAAFVVVFANMFIRTKRIIADLEERKGENVKRYSGRQISPLIPAGFLVNAIALLGMDHIPTEIRGVMLGIAIILLISGAIVTAIRRNR